MSHDLPSIHSKKYKKYCQTHERLRKMRKIALVSALALAGALTMTACGATGKAAQPYQDAKVSGVNDAPARQGTMPDGFSNFAYKCDGPNMVYVLYHADGAYGSLDVVPNDPRCTDG